MNIRLYDRILGNIIAQLLENSQWKVVTLIFIDTCYGNNFVSTFLKYRHTLSHQISHGRMSHQCSHFSTLTVTKQYN